ncbi:sulfurtransferase TusA family protein [Thermodesulfobacteriota bacterium]
MMSDAITADKVMDLKGLPCPMPVVKVSKGIKEIEIGQVLEAVSSDPGARADFPAWAKTSGNEILATEEDGKNTRFFIKRVK